MKYSLMDFDDISLLWIISYIDNLRERIRLKQVCKRFLKLTESSCRNYRAALLFEENIYYQKELNQSVEDIIIDLNSIFENYPKLAYLDLRCVRKFSIKLDQLKSMESLEKLIIDYRKSNFDEESVNKLFSYLPNLKYLYAYKFQLNLLNLNLIQSNLILLEFRGFRTSFHNLQKYLIQKGNKLEHISYVAGLSPMYNNVDIVRVIADHCPNIKFIKLNCRTSSFFHLKKLTNLEVIDFSSLCFNCNLEDLKLILISNKNLHSIFININDATCKDIIHTLIQYCPQIQNISIKCSHQDLAKSAEHLNLLSKLSNLKTINHRPVTFNR